MTQTEALKLLATPSSALSARQRRLAKKLTVSFSVARAPFETIRSTPIREMPEMVSVRFLALMVGSTQEEVRAEMAKAGVPLVAGRVNLKAYVRSLANELRKLIAAGLVDEEAVA